MRVSDSEWLLGLLSDERPHRLESILAQSRAARGHGLTVHSRAADLRKAGFVIACTVIVLGSGRRTSEYRLIRHSAKVAA